MATIRLPIRVSLAPDALDDVDIAVDGAIRDAFDIAEIVMREEGNQASYDIAVEGFGSRTGVAGALPLRIRTGRALRSIAAETRRMGEFHIVTRIGALNAPEDVERYLAVQGDGKTIRPVNADKLAFPPGDAGEPARDPLLGFQVLTAREFLEQRAALGYAFVRFTDNAILARPEGQREFELIFIRADEVTIPARHPIGSQEAPTAERIDRRLAEELG